MYLKVPLHDPEALKYYFKVYQLKLEREEEKELEDEEEDEDPIEVPDDWEKSLIKHHVYKSSTMKAVQKAYDNGGFETLDEARESL